MCLLFHADQWDTEGLTAKGFPIFALLVSKGDDDFQLKSKNKKDFISWYPNKKWNGHMEQLIKLAEYAEKNNMEMLEVV